jgi:ornithine carbamoyltransferase
MGVNFTVCSPKEYFPDEALRSTCEKIAKESGASLRYLEDTDEAVKNADVIYTDVWVSMGEPDEVWKERITALLPYQVNASLMAKAKPETVFMHCLPAYHDEGTAVARAVKEKFGIAELEVTNEVFESKQSIVFDEAENRMHTIKAVIASTL